MDDPRVLVLSVAGLVVYLVPFVFYMYLVWRGRVSPNASTWSIWAFLTLLNVVTYQSLSGDWVKTVMPYASCITNGITFLIALGRRRFEPLDRFEKYILAAGLTAGVVWMADKHAPYANLLVVSCIVVSTVPTIRGVWIKPEKESSWTWLTIGMSYLFSIAVVLLRFEQGWDLVFHIVAFCMNSSVGVLALRKTERRLTRMDGKQLREKHLYLYLCEAFEQLAKVQPNPTVVRVVAYFGDIHPPLMNRQPFAHGAAYAIMHDRAQSAVGHAESNIWQITSVEVHAERPGRGTIGIILEFDPI